MMWKISPSLTTFPSMYRTGNSCPSNVALRLYGKSTIFRLVNKLLLPASGEILVDGESIEKKRNYCGYMPQQDLLFPWRTVRENLLLPMEIRGGYSKMEMREKADAALESVGLKDWGDKMPKELSAAYAREQRVARTVLTGFRLLLLDEPFSIDYLTRIICGNGF